jgi:hypothetical protein
MSQYPTTTTATRYVVSCLPEDHAERYHFEITVEWRGKGKWAVKDGSYVLGSDGEWDYEPLPSSREDDWLATHRFDLETALKLAAEQAPKMTNGPKGVYDVAAAMADYEAGRAKENA